MIYLESHNDNPAYNTALEFYAFNELAKDEDVFYLWINSPCIVVGKNQNTREEIDQEYCDEHNIRIVRRVSGGGAVYQDHGTLNYTIISNENTEAFNFKSMSQPVIDSLAEIGVEATFTGRNDLQIGDRKFCGNSQYVRGKRIMHHGCILFDSDLSVLAKSLRVTKDKIESKGKKSVRARVTNIKEHLKDKSITNRDYLNLLREYMDKKYGLNEYILTPKDEAKVQAIMDEKNNSWDWVYGKNPEFTIQRNRRLPSGKVEAKINVVNGYIKGLKFYGDFFGVKDVSELADMLIGTAYDKKSISEVINKVNVDDYFMGVTNEVAIEILVD